MGDVGPHLKNFVNFRLSERNLKAKLIDLIDDELGENEYDIVISFDVIEHIPDPIPELRKIAALLKEGGLLIINIAFGYHLETPEHILHYKTGVMNKIRTLGF